MELREAKKPLVVEKRPIKAIAKVGKLMSGDKKMLSTLVRHEKTGARPAFKFGINDSGEKFLAIKSSAMTEPLLIILTTNAASTEITTRAVMMRGILGRDFRMKRRCGWVTAKMTQKTAK